MHRSYYENYANHKAFNGVGRVRIENPNIFDECTGTLISSRVVLSASHCLKGFSYDDVAHVNGNFIGQFTLVRDRSEPLTADNAVAITGARIVNHCYELFHDERNPGRSYYRVTDLCQSDIALLYLARPIFLPEYASIEVDAHPSSYIGKSVSFAGFGRTGTGNSMVGEPQNGMLAATMRVDDLCYQTAQSYPQLQSQFVSGHPSELLGAPGHGDSGAPVFTQLGDRFSIIAVHKGASWFSVVSNYGNDTHGRSQPNQSIYYDGYCSNPQCPCVMGQESFGYGTRRYFTVTSNFRDFLARGQVSQQVVSINDGIVHPLLWSEGGSWQGLDFHHDNRLFVDEFRGRDNEGAILKTFNAAINHEMVLDVSATVDALLIGASGKLLIPRQRELSSYSLKLAGGRLEIDGQLRGVNIEIEHGGIVTGTGMVSLVSPMAWHLKSREVIGYRSVNNTAGTVDLFRPMSPFPQSISTYFYQLKIDGGYVHGPLATLHVGVHSSVLASHLHVYDEIFLDGGSLVITTMGFGESRRDPITYSIIPNSSQGTIAARWTLLESNHHISGRFSQVLLQTHIGIPYFFALEYLPNRVDLVAYFR